MKKLVSMFFLALGKRTKVAVLPMASEVRAVGGQIEIGDFLVDRNGQDQQQDMTYLWRVRGPADKDGWREILDEHRTFREAVQDAKRRAKLLAWANSLPKKGPPPANTTPEAVDLRKAAIAFAEHRVNMASTVNMEDQKGQRLNRALLLAAISYARCVEEAS